MPTASTALSTSAAGTGAADKLPEKAQREYGVISTQLNAAEFDKTCYLDVYFGCHSIPPDRLGSCSQEIPGDASRRFPRVYQQGRPDGVRLVPGQRKNAGSRKFMLHFSSHVLASGHRLGLIIVCDSMMRGKNLADLSEVEDICDPCL